MTQNPPVGAGLEFTAEGKTMLASTLGLSCVSNVKIGVIMLGMTDGKLDMVSVQSGDCPVARFTVTPEIGHLVAAP